MNWQVALKLKQELTRLGIKCILTKQHEKQVVTNRVRAETANKAKAALFVRLHCDSGRGNGFTWYYPNHSAKKEEVTGPPITVQHESKLAANSLNETMRPLLKGFLKDNPVRTDAATGVGSRQGGVLTGSVFAKVPTTLIEMCFINQKKDALFISSSKGQKKMAYAIAQGIRQYLAYLYNRKQ